MTTTGAGGAGATTGIGAGAGGGTGIGLGGSGATGFTSAMTGAGATTGFTSGIGAGSGVGSASTIAGFGASRCVHHHALPALTAINAMSAAHPPPLPLRLACGASLVGVGA